MQAFCMRDLPAHSTLSRRRTPQRPIRQFQYQIKTTRAYVAEERRAKSEIGGDKGDWAGKFPHDTRHRQVPSAPTTNSTTKPNNAIYGKTFWSVGSGPRGDIVSKLVHAGESGTRQKTTAHPLLHTQPKTTPMTTNPRRDCAGNGENEE